MKLIQTIGDLKSFQLSQIQKIQNSEEELGKSKRKIQDLQYHCGKYGPPLPSLMNGHAQERHFETFCTFIGWIQWFLMAARSVFLFTFWGCDAFA